MVKESYSTEHSRRLRSRGGVLCASLAALVLALTGCGGSKHDAGTTSATTAADPVSEPNAVIVRVAGHPITKAQFEHRLAGEIKFEQLGGFAPVPPNYTACIAHVQAPSTTVGAKPSTATLKAQCEAQYHSLLKGALGPLIATQWVTGAAKEAGFSVSEAEVQAQLKREEGHLTQAQVLANLAKRDVTLPEFASEVKIEMLDEKFRHMLKAKAEHLTAAQVAAYYAAHKSQFATPQRRALYIARAATKAEALQAKRKLAAGRRFATVVKRLAPTQPIFSNDGYLAAYEPDLYREPPLNEAILAARPNVLSGPVKISLGYYVFEVKRVTPAVQEPLARAQTTIRATVPYERYKQALAAWVARFRAHWRALTTCSPGYVFAKCAGAPSEPEDGYTIG
jgi:PPIC-type PPIASE domain